MANIRSQIQEDNRTPKKEIKILYCKAYCVQAKNN